MAYRMNLNFRLFSFLVLLAILTSCEEEVVNTNGWRRQRLQGTNMSIALPPSLQVKSKEGPDFILFFITPKDSMKPKTLSGGIYMGSHPEAFEPGNDSVVRKNYTLNVLQAAQTLSVFSHKDSKFGQCILDLKADNVFMHVFGTAWQPNYLDTLGGIISSIQKIEPHE